MNCTRTLAGSLGAVALLTGLLTGCASGDGTAAAQAVPATQPMTPGMTMPDGSVMGTPHSTADAGEQAVRKPSEPAAMVCTDEFRGDLAEALSIRSVPPGRSTFNDALFTCTYRLFGGRLVLAVKDLPSAAVTDRYFAASRKALRGASALDGLTSGAVGSPAGVVVLRKDDHVLTVDATGMPAVFGKQRNKRADFAYEVASVVLGCWTGD